MDELLSYYNRELAFIRNLGAEFAEAHPKIAGRLRLSQDMAEDPHVSRLIEAFALLNARTRLKLEDEFPEITESLLNVLYPHYLAPLPSACIVQLRADKSQAQNLEPQSIPRGSRVETEPIDGEPCRFRTCYDVDLLPIEVSAASLKGTPLPAPSTRLTSQAQAVVRIELSTLSPKVAFRELTFDRLRFYLHGQTHHAYDLYERILNNAIGTVVAVPGGEVPPVELAQDCWQPVGFGRHEGLLDYSPRSFLGYRLLSEFFAFPDKFLFVELQGVTAALRTRLKAADKLELYVFLDEHHQDLERNVAAQSFRLGCTPLINLFKQRAEPIEYSQHRHEDRVVPDARRPAAHEVYSIDRVVATDRTDREVEIPPLFSIRHEHEGDVPVYWHATRTASPTGEKRADYGTEVMLSIVDLGDRPAAADDWTIDVETTCLNRDLPGRLPFGGGQPRLQLTSGAVLAGITCLTPPTRTRRPSLARGTHWRLISHLALNQLSLVDTSQGKVPLQELLRLYDTENSPQSRSTIEGLIGVASRPAVGRIGGSVAGGFARGLDVTLRFDEAKYSGGGLYLFASVLERFLALYCTVNSFVRTRIHTERREEPLCEWPPRAGERVLT